MSTTASTTKATPNKSAKKSLIIKLVLRPEHLAKFPNPHSSARQSTTFLKPEITTSVQPPAPTDKLSDSNITPVPAGTTDATDPNSLAPPKVDGRRKRGGATGVPGRRRAPPSIDPNAPMRERGRPGPKKKPRLADGSIDRTAPDGRKIPAASGNPIPAHKLGPKANTGAINAGLRALDRTGKPCRRWQRKGLQLKSFTGTLWDLSSWKAPSRDNSFAGDVKSDSTGSSELKPNESSAIASERSHNGGQDVPDMMQGIESSPAPPIAV